MFSEAKKKASTVGSRGELVNNKDLDEVRRGTMVGGGKFNAKDLEMNSDI